MRISIKNVAVPDSPFTPAYRQLISFGMITTWDIKQILSRVNDVELTALLNKATFYKWETEHEDTGEEMALYLCAYTPESNKQICKIKY